MGKEYNATIKEKKSFQCFHLFMWQNTENPLWRKLFNGENHFMVFSVFLRLFYRKISKCNANYSTKKKKNVL